MYATHGASNHSEGVRADYDYYATDPDAVEKLLEKEEFFHYILEPACGEGHISEVLLNHGYDVISSDIVHRGYENQQLTEDFLKSGSVPRNSRDIITNPPYAQAKEFVEHALDISQESVKIAMFLKLTFLEGIKRKGLFDKYPPKTIYVFRNRIDCWKNGIKPEKPSKAVCYAWFVWVKGFKGNPQIKWI
ncbi:MAG: NAD(P)-dependent oxidoreductase [Ruminococcaceae bacterium]|nr:NAD(P)-dependent oxidoreductase [Oscillospiraceae bacterium]